MDKRIIIPILAAVVIGSAIIGTNLGSSASANSNHSKIMKVSNHETNDNHLTALHSKTKITQDKAKAIALEKVPGTVKKSELEDEDGVVVYSIEVQTVKGEVREVKVNAHSGKVLKVESNNHENGQEETTKYSF